MNNHLGRLKRPTAIYPTGRQIGGILTFLLGATTAFGQSPSSDRFVQQTLASASEGRVNVIIRSAQPLTERQEAKLGHLGGYVYRHLSIVRSAAISLPKKNLRKLMALPYVEHVSQDLSVQKTDAFSVGSSGADVAWQQYGVSGSGVGVAVIDSGIQPDNDFGGQGILGVLLNSRVTANVNFSPDSWLPYDLCGHGTHVAGIIAGDGKSSTGPKCFQAYYGIARDANLVNVRVLDSMGRGNVSQVIAGIQWVVSHKSQYNIRVINLSMGHPIGESYSTDPLCQAVEAAWKSGIVVVVAAGNEGRASSTQTAGASNEGFGTAYGSIQSPGNDPYVITVGAMKSSDGQRAHDMVATYSSRGPSRLDFVVKPDIMAPGNRIVSILAHNAYLERNYSDTNGVAWTEYTRQRPGYSNEYFRLSGTSMAAPVVAGAAALMLQRYPNLSPDTVKARLMVSATKWASPNGTPDVFSYGAGYLNIPAALQSTLVVTQPAVSPSARWNADGTVSLNYGRAIWGTTEIENGRAIWGTGVVEGGPTPVVAEPDGRAIWGTGVWTDMSTTRVENTVVDLSSKVTKGD